MAEPSQRRLAGHPNKLPRPKGELEALEAAWELPKGWRIISAVNNTVIGYFYVATAVLFFLLAGILALLMRLQLAVPSNTFLSAETYNQIFTMHGTVMMFLFAVPVVEAMGVLLLPQMLGARDLPFPRLSAFAFWAYFVGGLIFFGTLFFDLAPSGGWFMYPPLTGQQFSPGLGADFWLLGIGFIEISAIAGAIELIVGVLRTRAPGMTLDRMPMFAWTMLIFAGMIVFAFPAVILATMLLELERAFGWPFFIPAKGGDALLWQHLFWFFGHPEVYIIFLPAAGMVSMIVPTMARTPLVGYRLVVVALIATAFFSFGLWVHHMFTTGIPALSLAFFSAASMAVAIPSGIQVFAWIATIAAGRLRLATPSLFVLGFLFIFTLGGLTGVMVAMVPFDWQVHDTYFVVAHFHYVLVGGMVFPLFGAFYYWAPAFSGRALSERLGKVTFALMFVGFNVAFFPMHITGLMGMPRRVYTYPAVTEWGVLNMISTVGAFLFAAGVLVFLFDLVRNLRPTVSEPVGDVWKGASLEWLHNHIYGPRSIPLVESRDPLWDEPGLAEDSKAGRHYLPGTITGVRETIVTSPVEATPQALLRLPGYGWSPLLAAVGTAGFFMLLTVKLVTLGVHVRRIRGRDDPDLDVGQRPEAGAPRRDRSRHHGADICLGFALALVVGDGHPAAGRGLALPRLRVLLSLSLDRFAAGLAESRAASLGGVAARVRAPARGEQCVDPLFGPRDSRGVAQQRRVRRADRGRRSRADRGTRDGDLRALARGSASGRRRARRHGLHGVLPPISARAGARRDGSVRDRAPPCRHAQSSPPRRVR